MKKDGVRNSGFTLIELLTVVVIISILVGLTGTAAVSMRRNALKKQRETHKKTLAAVCRTYLHEYKKWPVSTIPASSTGDKLVNNHQDIMDHLRSTLDTMDSSSNPDNPRNIHFMRTVDIERDSNGKWIDPVNRTPYNIYINFEINEMWVKDGDEPST
ncbi:hypothetical protein BVX97_00170 [bacterium E08(2017)]|nr:hypothetical protein BVX97_00170 [bacterium E08(2017)]